MARIKGLIGKDTAVSRQVDGDQKTVRLSVDGALIAMDWAQAMLQEGRGFTCRVGGFDSPGTGGGKGTTLDTNQPEFLLDIPEGVTVYPKRVHITLVEGALAADLDESEIVLGVDQDAQWSVTTPGTGTTTTIYNLNTLHSRASMCVAKTQFTVDTTPAVLDLELAHVQRILDILTVGKASFQYQVRKGFELVYEPNTPSPAINGPAMLVCYWGGTIAALAYATFEWFELPS